MPRFYLDEHAEVTQKEILLSEKESRHALKVLRLKAGQVVEAVDGKGKHMRGISPPYGRAGWRWPSIVFHRQVRGRWPA